MELDSKAIEQGHKTKDAVVAECLEMHRKHYQRMQAERAVFEEAIDIVLADAGGFDLLGENEPIVAVSIGKCGDCHSAMCLKASTGRGGQNNYLLWCDACRIAIRLPSGDPTDANTTCNHCHFGKITLARPRGAWTLCPKCKSDAASQPKTVFAVVKCPNPKIICHSKEMCIGKNQYGGWELSCCGSAGVSACNFRASMPKAVKTVILPAPPAGESLPRLCNRCKILPKMDVQLEGRLPAGVDHHDRRCLKCDEDLRELSGYWWDKVAASGAAGRGRGASNPGRSQHSRNATTSQNNVHNINRSNNRITNQRQAANTSYTSNQGRNSSENSRNAHRNAAGPMCSKCRGVDLERCTSRSERNPGRQFWKCGNRDCNGFVGWVDDLKENSRNSSSASSRRMSGGGHAKKQKVGM